MLRVLILLFTLSLHASLHGQRSSIYDGLPVGRFDVGFSILTFTDSSRVALASRDYGGNTVKGDRHKKITVHMWYPAGTSKGEDQVDYNFYCSNRLLNSTRQEVSGDDKSAEVLVIRRSVERWFGSTADSNWNKLLTARLLARKDVEPARERYPLLMGMLRPLSTCITNEMLASNGYVVAMVRGDNQASFSEAALADIPDLQHAIAHLARFPFVDAENVGVFGFSGSGFTPVLFAMSDARVKALADIESGIYMDELFQALSLSNYYRPHRLKIPFLHLFSRDLSKQEKFISEFEQKTKFSKRYRVLLNQPALHHWDFAAEGYTAALFLKNRNGTEEKIKQSFEIASHYLLHFFNAELKNDTQSQAFMINRPKMANVSDSMWEVKVLDPVQPAPDLEQWKSIIQSKGITFAVDLARRTIADDSSTNLLQWVNLNRLGYTFLQKQRYEDAIGVFILNTQLHPEDPNLFDSLAEGYEAAGDVDNMRNTANKILALLSKIDHPTEAQTSLRTTALKRLSQEKK